jgi:hypothetical protein
MNKSKEKRAAAPNRVAAGKRASWPLSPTKKNGFVGFAGFVTIKTFTPCSTPQRQG